MVCPKGLKQALETEKQRTAAAEERARQFEVALFEERARSAKALAEQRAALSEFRFNLQYEKDVAVADALSRDGRWDGIEYKITPRPDAPAASSMRQRLKWSATDEQLLLRHARFFLLLAPLVVIWQTARKHASPERVSRARVARGTAAGWQKESWSTAPIVGQAAFSSTSSTTRRPWP